MEIKDIIYYEIQEMQQCLAATGKLLCQYDDKEQEWKRGRQVVESAILKECVGCDCKEQCTFTMEDKDQLGILMEMQGGLSRMDVRKFHPCRKEEEFVQEANQIYERELYLRSMEQTMVQMRKLIGRQYLEAGKMLGLISQEQSGCQELGKSAWQNIKKGMERKQLKVKDACVYENSRKERQIYLQLKKKKGREVAAKEIATYLSEIMHRKMQPLSGQKKIVGNHYEVIGFGPTAKFHVLGGVISKACQEQQENGDSFSMGELGERRYISMISDGMGTGSLARRESRRTVETLEELLQAGIPEERAISIVESLFTFWPQKEGYATLDFLQIDLFAGIGTFCKIGACQSFLKRKEHVEILKTQSVPVGDLGGQGIPFYRKKLEAEDLILQISDGVIDGLEGDGIQMIGKWMKEITTIRPQAFVEELYQKIQESGRYQCKDDMTMIALGIWDKY